MDEPDPAEVRVATRLFLAQRKITQAQFQKDAGINITASSFSRFLSGVHDLNDLRAINDYLIKEGFIPINGPPMSYRASSQFFHIHSDEQCREWLTRCSGHYRCYQLSSWFDGLITVSHLEIKPPTRGDLHCEVIERQYSGAPSHCNYIENIVGRDIGEEEEIFEGCCFYSYYSLVFLLRSRQAKFIKNVICSVFDRNTISMSGNMQKSTQRKGGGQIHISPLCLEALKDDLAINPRIELLERLEKPEIQKFFHNKCPSINWISSNKAIL